MKPYNLGVSVRAPAFWKVSYGTGSWAATPSGIQSTISTKGSKAMFRIWFGVKSGMVEATDFRYGSFSKQHLNHRMDIRCHPYGTELLVLLRSSLPDMLAAAHMVGSWSVRVIGPIYPQAPCSCVVST